MNEYIINNAKTESYHKKYTVLYLEEEDAPGKGAGAATSRRGFLTGIAVESTTFFLTSAAGSTLGTNALVGVADRELSALALNCSVHRKHCRKEMK